MKITVMKSVIVALMMMTTTDGLAQTSWSYSYDNTGNRISRQVTASAARQRTSDKNELLSDGNVSAVLYNGRDILKITVLKFDHIGHVSVALYDLQGREMLSRQLESEVTNISLSNLSRGTYILSVDIDGEKISRKFNK